MAVWCGVVQVETAQYHSIVVFGQHLIRVDISQTNQLVSQPKDDQINLGHELTKIYS